MKKTILLDWAESNYANYQGQWLNLDIGIEKLFKVSTAKEIDEYLNYRPLGKTQNIMGEYLVKLTFLEKSIKMENKEVILAYLPYLNKTNQQKFIHLFLESHLILSDKFDIPEFHSLIHNVKLNEKVESKFLLSSASWMKAILENPKNNLLNSLKEKEISYWNFILQEYISDSVKSTKRKECFHMLLSHQLTPVELLIEINDKMEQVYRFLNHTKFKTKAENEVLIPLKKAISLKEMNQIELIIPIKNKEEKKLKL